MDHTASHGNVQKINVPEIRDKSSHVMKKYLKKLEKSLFQHHLHVVEVVLKYLNSGIST